MNRGTLSPFANGEALEYAADLKTGQRSGEVLASLLSNRRPNVIAGVTNMPLVYAAPEVVPAPITSPIA